MPSVNLLPPEYKAADQAQGRSSGPIGGYVVVGALTLALAAAGLHVKTANDVDRATTEAATAQADVLAAQAVAAELAPYRAQAAAAAARVEGVRTLAGSRYPWDRTLKDVARALPASAHVTNLDASTTSAGGGSAVRGALEAPALVLKGCVDRQGQIPDLLSRLGDVRGATRVVLGSSKSNDTGDVSPDAACRAKTAPTFEVTVFFGEWKSTLPATTAAGAAATPTPTPTPAPAGAPPSATTTPAATPGATS